MPHNQHLTSDSANKSQADETFVRDFALAAILFLAIYGYLIFRLGLISDEVWNLCGDDQSLFVASGRWGTALYRDIFSVKTAPFAYGIASTLFYSLAIVLQIRILGINSQCMKFLYMSMIVGMIQISYLMSYAANVDTMTLGILTVTAAYLLVFSSKTAKCTIGTIGTWIAAIFFVAYAMGVYQTIATIPVCLWMGRKMLHYKDQTFRDTLKECNKIFLLYAIAVPVYFIISHICKLYTPQYMLERIATYQQSIQGWSGEYIPGKRDLCKFMLAHIMGEHQGEWVYTATLAPVLMLLIKTWLYRKSAFMRKAIFSALVICIYLFPLLPVLIMRWDSLPRLFVCMPFACGILWVAAVTSINIENAKRCVKWACISLGLFVILKASYAVCGSAYIQKRQYEDVAKQLEEVRYRALLTQVPDAVDVFSCPIILCGPMEQRYPSVEQGLVINLTRSMWLSLTRTEMCRHFGRDDMYDAMDSRIPKEKLDEILSSMQTYPAKGCTRYVDGEIIVKLAEEEQQPAKDKACTGGGKMVE